MVEFVAIFRASAIGCTMFNDNSLSQVQIMHLHIIRLNLRNDYNCLTDVNVLADMQLFLYMQLLLYMQILLYMQLL